MDDDLKAVVGRATRAVERPDVKLDGDLCLIHGDDLRTLLSAIRQRDEALEPFVAAFEAARERYVRRYRDKAEIGAANFDKMPDEWPVSLPAPFRMGQYRKARAILTGSETNAR